MPFPAPDYEAPIDVLPKPKYDHVMGVERSFGYLYMDTPKVFYNRVPKAGSRSVIRMLRVLRNMNDFQFIESTTYMNYTVSTREEVRYTNREHFRNNINGLIGVRNKNHR